MPTLAEVRAYIFGVRLEQAGLAARTPFATQVAHALFIRLADAAEALRFAGLSSERRGSLTKVLGAVIRHLNHVSRKPIELPDVWCDFCCRQLSMADSIVLSWTTSLVLQTPTRDWFELGRQIVKGEGGDPPHPGAEQQTRRAWAWHDPKALKKLMTRVGIRQTNLFPRSSAEEPWLVPLPVRFAEWQQIEVGVQKLEESVEEERVAALKREEASKKRLELTDLQRLILKTLKDRPGLTQKELAKAVNHRDDVLRKKNNLPELRKRNLVAHKRGLGYYRPDAPPSDVDEK